MFFFFFEQISRFDMENYSTEYETRVIIIVKFRISLITKRGFTFDTYYRPSKFNLATNFIARDANH